MTTLARTSAGVVPATAAPTEGTTTTSPSPLVAVLAGIMVLSVLVGFFGLFAFGLSALQEQRSQHVLHARFRGLLDPSSPVAPSIGGTIAAGTPLALLTVPQAGLHQAVVVEGTSTGDLLAGPGLLPDSPLPGQAGQSIVMGTSVTADGPFASLGRLHRGDRITVTTGQGTFRYVVEDTRVAGQRLPVAPASGSLLTLVTSEGTGLLGRLAPSRILYVDAALRGRAVPAPAGRPTSVPAADIQGHGDPAAWPFVVFWLQALLVGLVAAVWSWSRWGRWQTWLVGGPVLFAVMWGLSTEVIRLLPNVY